MFSRLAVLVGSAEGRIKLELKGSVGVNGAVVLKDGSIMLVTFVGLSQAVCTDVNDGRSTVEGLITLFVSIWNFDCKIVVVILLMRSAVLIWPFLPKRPQPLFGLFKSPIVFAAALMTVLRFLRSSTAGVAMTAGARMMPVASMAPRVKPA